MAATKKLPYILLAIVVVGAVVVATVLLTILLYINSLVVAAVEKGGTYALGTRVSLQNCDLRPLAGKMSLLQLKVYNPTGFTGDTFFYFENASTSVDLSTLQKPTIVIPEFSMSGVALRLERAGDKSNYQTILDSVAAKSAGSSSTPAPSSPAPKPKDEKHVVINSLILKKIDIEVRFAGGKPANGLAKAVGDLTTVKIPIDEIRLTNVGKTGSGVGGTGVTPGELVSIIARAVMAAAAEKGGSLLPTDMLGDIQGNLSKFADGVGVEVIGDVKATVNGVAADAAKAAQGAVEGAAKEGQKALDNLGKGLGDLIPGGKKKDEPKKP